MSPPLPRILPIHVGNQSRALLLRFGRALYQACHVRTERFGLLASADLVRRDQPDASARPLPLERTISHVISAIDLSDLSAVPEDPAVCGLNPIVALIAALAPLRAHGTIRSFEVVTRVGLLTASFDVGT